MRYDRLEDIPPGQTDWARVDAMTDEEIEAAIADDPDAASIWTEEEFARSHLLVPMSQRDHWLRLDDDIVAWFARYGEERDARMREVLRAYMARHRDEPE
mgnify:CR=1 FL=1